MLLHCTTMFCYVFYCYLTMLTLSMNVHWINLAPGGFWKTLSQSQCNLKTNSTESARWLGRIPMQQPFRQSVLLDWCATTLWCFVTAGNQTSQYQRMKSLANWTKTEKNKLLCLQGLQAIGNHLLSSDNTW